MIIGGGFCEEIAAYGLEPHRFAKIWQWPRLSRVALVHLLPLQDLPLWRQNFVTNRASQFLGSRFAGHTFAGSRVMGLIKVSLSRKGLHQEFKV